MNEKSGLTVDAEASVAKAYDSALPMNEQDSVWRHLTLLFPS